MNEEEFTDLDDDHYESKIQKMQLYYEGDEFVRVYETLVGYLEENEIKAISEHDVMYEPQKQPISKDDFYNLINSIGHHNDEIGTMTEHGFPKITVEYKKIIITTIIGQGSFTIISLGDQ